MQSSDASGSQAKRWTPSASPGARAMGHGKKRAQQPGQGTKAIATSLDSQLPSLKVRQESATFHLASGWFHAAHPMHPHPIRIASTSPNCRCDLFGLVKQPEDAAGQEHRNRIYRWEPPFRRRRAEDFDGAARRDKRESRSAGFISIRLDKSGTRAGGHFTVRPCPSGPEETVVFSSFRIRPGAANSISECKFRTIFTKRCHPSLHLSAHRRCAVS